VLGRRRDPSAAHALTIAADVAEIAEQSRAVDEATHLASSRAHQIRVAIVSFRRLTRGRPVASGLLFSSVMRPLVVCAVLAACSFEAPRQEPASTVDAATTPTPTIDASVVPSVDAPVVSSMTPSQFIEELVRLECVQAFACKPSYPMNANRTFEDAWGTDVNNCVVTDSNYRQRNKIDAAITAGRITYDLASAHSCLAAPGIPTTCAALFQDSYEFASVCFVALAGHVADGAACTTSWECGALSDCRSGTCSH
jgi:hypothetical protein